MLEVVQDKEQLAVLEEGQQPARGLALAADGEVDRLGDGETQCLARCDRLQRNEDGAVRQLRSDGGGGLDCQTRLADPSRPDKRDQGAALLQNLAPDYGELVFTADEGCGHPGERAWFEQRWCLRRHLPLTSSYCSSAALPVGILEGAPG